MTKCSALFSSIQLNFIPLFEKACSEFIEGRGEGRFSELLALRSSISEQQGYLTIREKS
jgi:hypothetical protein